MRTLADSENLAALQLVLFILFLAILQDPLAQVRVPRGEGVPTNCILLKTEIFRRLEPFRIHSLEATNKDVCILGVLTIDGLGKITRFLFSRSQRRPAVTAL